MPDADYAMAARRIMVRSATRQGTIADQRAGDAAASLGLRRTAALAGAMGRPQDGLAIVHVAGTKGKGSTVAFIASMLVAGGIRTGRFTSPHLAKLTERIAIDERDIDDVAFAVIADRVLTAARAMESDRPELGTVNAFEVLFVMALVAFREAGCRVAVIEVGIGGRLDTTNIVEPAVSVITTLDLEHTAILGDTLPKIAAEKAGIIKPGRPVVSAPQPEEALAVIRAWAETNHSRLTVATATDLPDAASLGLTGAHQVLNAGVALAAVRELGEIDRQLVVEGNAIRNGLARAWLPGRFEVVPAQAIRRFTGIDASIHPLVVVLDGAHTPRAAGALRVAVDRMSGPDGDLVAIAGFAADKDIPAFLAELRPDRLLPVAAASLRAVPAGEIAAAAAGLDIGLIDGPATVAAGLNRLLRDANPSITIVVTGSFAVVAEAREALALTDNRPVDAMDVGTESFDDETERVDRA